MIDQLNLFGGGPVLPEGFVYRPEIVGPDEERELVAQVRTLPFREFEFHGYTGKRRVISFGWRYDFESRLLQKVDDIPPFLLSLRYSITFRNLREG